LISQEQELCGTYAYDPEETPVDSNAASPSSLYYKPTAFPLPSSPSQEDIYGPAYMQQQQEHELPPPPRAQLPTEPIHLAPNRRRASLDSVPPPTRKFQQQQQQQQQQQALSLAERFNNPATNVSRLKQSFRAPIGT